MSTPSPRTSNTSGVSLRDATAHAHTHSHGEERQHHHDLEGAARPQRDTGDRAHPDEEPEKGVPIHQAEHEDKCCKHDQQQRCPGLRSCRQGALEQVGPHDPEVAGHEDHHTGQGDEQLYGGETCLRQGEDGKQQAHEPEIGVQPPQAGGDPAGGDDRIRLVCAIDTRFWWRMAAGPPFMCLFGRHVFALSERVARRSDSFYHPASANGALYHSLLFTSLDSWSPSQ